MNFRNLENFLDDMAANHTVGNAVEVYKDEKLVFRYASGYSDLEKKLPLSGEEFFNIYSCSKITTCVETVMLEESQMPIAGSIACVHSCRRFTSNASSSR